MKVVLLAPEFATTDGGIQRILRLYLTALASDAAHTRIELVTLNDTAAELARLPVTSARQILGKPLQVTGCGGSKITFTRAAWLAGSGAHRLVCGHIGQLPVAALAARRGCALALVAHGIEVWEPTAPLNKLALRRANRVFCVSNYTRNTLAKLHPRLVPGLRVVPNALDPALMAEPAPLPPPQGSPPVVLCVGRLSAADAYKGYDHLLRAFALLLPSAFRAPLGLAPRLRFVGEGDDQPRLRALAIKLQIADRVEFSGRLPDGKLRQAFADCTCFALPSTGEGFGLVYLEALAAGRPCVGVAAAAVPELIHSNVGVLAIPGNDAALAAALTECLVRAWDPVALRQTALCYDHPRLIANLVKAWD
jgi:glycosyltransferase involved in cell wall biosynthesis